MKNLQLYEMKLDFGRMGQLGGLFLATEAEIDSIIGKEIYFGEVLGKHSEVYVSDFKREYLRRIEGEVESLIEDLHTVFGQRTLCGYNPVEIYQEYLRDNGLEENENN